MFDVINQAVLAAIGGEGEYFEIAVPIRKCDVVAAIGAIREVTCWREIGLRALTVAVKVSEAEEVIISAKLKRN